jgi:hypothetical protein
LTGFDRVGLPGDWKNGNIEWFSRIITSHYVHGLDGFEQGKAAERGAEKRTGLEPARSGEHGARIAFAMQFLPIAMREFFSP